MKQKITNLKNKIIEKWEYIKDNKVLIAFCLGLFPIAIYAYIHHKEYSSKKAEIKRRLKHFNPTIKQGLFGEYVEWSGRDKPLTDEEVDELIKN